MLGLELTSLTSVSSEVLPTPEQLSSSCRRSSCFRSAASAHEKTGKKNLSYENGHKNLNLLKEDCCDDSILHYLLLYTWKKKTTTKKNK